MRMKVKSLSTSVKVLAAVLASALFITMIGSGQVKSKVTQTPTTRAAKAGPQPGDLPLCSGAFLGSPAGQALSRVNPRTHSVTLSWNAVRPSSNSPLDVIKGYYVYRSLTSHTYTEANRISGSPLRGTKCVDTTVESQKAYFYVVKAVTEGGKESGSSIEIRAVVPFP
jgi:hypothetical protein